MEKGRSVRIRLLSRDGRLICEGVGGQLGSNFEFFPRVNHEVSAAIGDLAEVDGVTWEIVGISKGPSANRALHYLFEVAEVPVGQAA